MSEVDEEELERAGAAHDEQRSARRITDNKQITGRPEASAFVLDFSLRTARKRCHAAPTTKD